MDQLSRLLGKLAQHMRSLCVKADCTGAETLRYQTVINALREAFELGIYNLNYDTAALTAWPEANTGFDETGIFEPSLVHDQNEKWNFVHHLHGSVHHSLVGRLGNEICWRRNLLDTDNFFDTQEGQWSDKRSEGRSFPITTLIAGGFKLDQMLVEPFHSMHAALVRHLYAADAILIGGYGFGDVHINRALRNRLAVPGVRPPVMVLDWASNLIDPMAFRADLWAYELSATLRTGGNFFLEPGHSSPPVPFDLAAGRSFEVAALHRVAIWYGGFTEAATRVDSIVRWLDGGSDESLRP